jgi:hypothetical protein
VVLDTQYGSSAQKAHRNHFWFYFDSEEEAKMAARQRRVGEASAAVVTLLSRPVISVPEAGAILNLSRNGAYEAAKRGDFETLRMGKLILVPTLPLKRKLGMV